MHVDTLMTSAWNAVQYGCKRWLFWDPSQEPFLYNGEVDAFEPDLSRFPRFAGARALECLQHPGDIVFTPSGWWHQVMNESLCFSVTENFVNGSNIEQVRTYLENRTDQIQQIFQVSSARDVRDLLHRYIPELNAAAR